LWIGGEAHGVGLLVDEHEVLDEYRILNSVEGPTVSRDLPIG